MKTLLLVFGALAILKGIVFLVSPDFIVRYMEYWMNKTQLAGYIALGIGAAMIFLSYIVV